MNHNWNIRIVVQQHKLLNMDPEYDSNGSSESCQEPDAPTQIVEHADINRGAIPVLPAVPETRRDGGSIMDSGYITDGTISHSNL